MSIKRLDSKNNVEHFISELREILLAPIFDVRIDLDILLKKKNEEVSDPCTTANTLLTLEFDKDDVCKQLLKITAADYVETIIDNKNSELPPFYVFCRKIQRRYVYIKVKIRDRINGKVFCVSFHFARYSFKRPFPYET